MLIKSGILLLIGLASGLAIASGIVAFITMIGIVTRLAARTKTAAHITLYEKAIILGTIVGNVISIFYFHLPVGYIGLVIYGLFSGMFVGCLAISLAEVLSVFPIMIKRIALKQGMVYVVTALALGKCFGTLLQFWYKG